MNHCIDAVVSDTLKLEEKQSVYRKLGFIYTREVLWLFATHCLPAVAHKPQGTYVNPSQVPLIFHEVRVNQELMTGLTLWSPSSLGALQFGEDWSGHFPTTKIYGKLFSVGKSRSWERAQQAPS